MKRWTAHLKTAALTRIKEQEAFLDACGIMPVAGMEQEFYVATPYHLSPTRMARDSFSASFVSSDFEGSPFIEGVYNDMSDKWLNETVIGTGNHWRKKARPHASQAPSVIVKATDGVRKLMEAKIAEYSGTEGAQIDYDGSQVDASAASLQTNVSLWNKSTKAPLFPNYSDPPEQANVTTALAQYCAKGLLEAQKELAAVAITSPQALKRLQPLELNFSPKRFSFGLIKEPHKQHSLILRNTLQVNRNGGLEKNHVDSVYFENLLPGGNEEPALTMLVSLGGLVRGVKDYMQEHNIASPEAMKAHMETAEFKKPTRIDEKLLTIERLPESLSVALNRTQNSKVAKEILGEELHKAFCEAFERQNMQSQSR